MNRSQLQSPAEQFAGNIARYFRGTARRLSRGFAVSLVLASAMFSASSVRAQSNWTGLNNNLWSNSLNWNPANIPNTDLEDATITFGTPTIDNDITIRNLTLSNAQILGLSMTSLNVTGSFSWNNSQIGTDALMLVQGAATLTGALGNYGTLTFDTASISSATGSTLDNHGLINVISGKLTLRGGTNSGELSAIGDGSIEIAGTGYNFAGGAIASGDGTYLISSVATLASSLTLSMQHLNLAGTIHGGTLEISDRLNWTGGVMRNGRTSILSGATVNLSGNTILDSRKLSNAGRIDWGSGGSMLLQNSATLSNAGVFNITSGNTSLVGSNGGIFENSGTLLKSVGSTSILATITNTGTIIVSSGTLTLGAGSSSGTIVVQSGGTLRFAAGSVDPFDLSDGQSISNAGSFINAGYLKATSSALDGKSLIMDADSAGELYMTGNFNTASFTWNRGVISGAGVTTTAGINWTNPAVQWGVGGGRTLENTGIINWNAGVWGLSASAVSVFDPDSPGTIRNQSSANFNINSSATLGLVGASDKLNFENHGTLLVASNQTAQIYATVSNDGTLDVRNGAALHLIGNGTNGGTVSIGEGATFIAGGNGIESHTFSSAAQIVTSGASISPRSAIFDQAETHFSGGVSPAVDLHVGRNENSPGTLTVHSVSNFSPRSVNVHSGLMQVATGAMVSTGAASIGLVSGSSPAVVQVDSGATFSSSSYFQDFAGQLDLRGGNVVSTTPATINGLLVGAGTIDTPSANVNASVNPGGFESIGQIRFTGDLSLASSSAVTFKIDADTQTHDRIKADGSIDLGGDGDANGAYLFVYVTGNPANLSASNTFTIIKTKPNGRTGKFTIDLPGKVFAYSTLNEQIGYFDVGYAHDEVILQNYTTVPEPTSLWVLGTMSLFLRPIRRLTPRRGAGLP